MRSQVFILCFISQVKIPILRLNYKQTNKQIGRRAAEFDCHGTSELSRGAQSCSSHIRAEVSLLRAEHSM